MGRTNFTTGLHVVPQYTYHADAEIVGTAESLIALRDAISYALKRGFGEMQVFASDGEGYTLNVRRLSLADFDKTNPYYAFMEQIQPTKPAGAATGGVMDSTTDAEREAFEAWWDSLPKPPMYQSREVTDDLVYLAKESARAGFEAGRAQALAEVAAMEPLVWIVRHGNVLDMTSTARVADEWADIGRTVTPLIARPQPDAPEGGEKAG